MIYCEVLNLVLPSVATTMGDTMGLVALGTMVGVGTKAAMIPVKYLEKELGTEKKAHKKGKSRKRIAKIEVAPAKVTIPVKGVKVPKGNKMTSLKRDKFARNAAKSINSSKKRSKQLGKMKLAKI